MNTTQFNNELIHTIYQRTPGKLCVLSSEGAYGLKKTWQQSSNHVNATSKIEWLTLDDLSRKLITLLWPFAYRYLPKSKSEVHQRFWPLLWINRFEQFQLIYSQLKLKKRLVMDRPLKYRWVSQKHQFLKNDLSHLASSSLEELKALSKSYDKMTLMLECLSTEQQLRLMTYVLKQHPECLEVVKKNMGEVLVVDKNLFENSYVVSLFKQLGLSVWAGLDAQEQLPVSINCEVNWLTIKDLIKPPSPQTTPQIITNEGNFSTWFLNNSHLSPFSTTVVCQDEVIKKKLKLELEQNNIPVTVIDEMSLFQRVGQSTAAQVLITHLKLLNGLSISISQFQELMTFLFKEPIENLLVTEISWIQLEGHLSKIREKSEVNAWLVLMQKCVTLSIKEQFYLILSKIIYEAQASPVAYPELNVMAKQLDYIKGLLPIYSSFEEALSYWCDWVLKLPVYYSQPKKMDRSIHLVELKNFSMAPVRQHCVLYFCEMESLKESLAENTQAIIYDRENSTAPEISLKDNGFSYQEQLREEQRQIFLGEKLPTAIVAGPGTGKTFVNLALVDAAIKAGVLPEKIILMTYMDSATEHLKQRLSQLNLSSERMPAVTTIHRLAKKIVQTPLFEPFDWQADHTNLSVKLLTEWQQIDYVESILDKLYPVEAQEVAEMVRLNPSALLKTIQQFKSRQISVDKLEDELTLFKNKGFPRLRRFLPVYREYEKLLNINDGFDYSDLLQQAIYRLQSDERLLRSIQEKWVLLIEDEAQDSSPLQSELLQIISSQPSQTLIRTGDPNQSITTYNGTRLKDFNYYIQAALENSTLVTLTESARSAPEIQQVANNLILWSQSQLDIQSAFFKVLLKPVKNENPELLFPVTIGCFNTVDEEKVALLSKIKWVQQNYPELTQAVLCRSNRQVNTVKQLIQAEGLVSVDKNKKMESTEQSVIECFSSILKAIQNKSYTVGDGVNQALEVELNISWPGVFSLSLKPLDALSRFVKMLEANQVDTHLFEEKLFQLNQLSERYTESLRSQLLSYLDWLILELPKLSVLVLKNNKLGSADEEKIQVMTIHKAKGQEFDVVYIIDVSENSFSSSAKSVWLNEADKTLCELGSIDYLATEHDGQYDYEVVKQRQYEAKQDKAQEEARLLYVAMTRAQKGLMVTCSKERWNATRDYKSQSIHPFLLALPLQSDLEGLLDYLGDKTLLSSHQKVEEGAY